MLENIPTNTLSHLPMVVDRCQSLETVRNYLTQRDIFDEFVGNVIAVVYQLDLGNFHEGMLDYVIYTELDKIERANQPKKIYLTVLDGETSEEKFNRIFDVTDSYDLSDLVRCINAQFNKGRKIDLRWIN